MMLFEMLVSMSSVRAPQAETSSVLVDLMADTPYVEAVGLELETIQR